MNILFDTWHWSFSGLAIGIIMLVLTYFGKTFGMSSNLRTLCSMTPAKSKVLILILIGKSKVGI